MDRHNLQRALETAHMKATGKALYLPSIDGCLVAWGKTVPSAAAGYAPGCLFIDYDAAAGQQVWVNEGTVTSCTFKRFEAGDISLLDNEMIKFGTGNDVTVEWDAAKLEILPATNDEGAIHIGNGTKDIDLKWFAGGTGSVLFDVGNALITLAGGVCMFWKDAAAVLLGDDMDAELGWDDTRDYVYLDDSAMWNNCPLGARYDQGKYHEFFDDFLSFTLADWTHDEAGGGSASEAAQDAVGGTVLVTLAAGDNDASQYTWPIETFQLVTGKLLWFEVRAKFSEATAIDWFLGLIAAEDMTADDPIEPNDGVGFRKDAGDTQIDFLSVKNGTDTTNANEGTADTSWHTYGFQVDSDGHVTPYIDGTIKTEIDSANICDDEIMAFTALVRNGDASARTMEIDYVKVVQVR